MPLQRTPDLTQTAQRGVDDAVAIYETILLKVGDSGQNRHDVASRLAAAVYAHVADIGHVRGDPNDPTSGRTHG